MQAPMTGWLIAARFVSGVGLGAEIVVGYATLLEFVPPGPEGPSERKRTDTGGEFRVGRLFTGVRDRRTCLCGRSGPLGGRVDGGWGR